MQEEVSPLENLTDEELDSVVAMMQGKLKSKRKSSKPKQATNSTDS